MNGFLATKTEESNTIPWKDSDFKIVLSCIYLLKLSDLPVCLDQSKARLKLEHDLGSFAIYLFCELKTN